jgi:hypothetical protein
MTRKKGDSKKSQERDMTCSQKTGQARTREIGQNRLKESEISTIGMYGNWVSLTVLKI